MPVQSACIRSKVISKGFHKILSVVAGYPFHKIVAGYQRMQNLRFDVYIDGKFLLNTIRTRLYRHRNLAQNLLAWLGFIANRNKTSTNSTNGLHRGLFQLGTVLIKIRKWWKDSTQATLPVS